MFLYALSFSSERFGGDRQRGSKEERIALKILGYEDIVIKKRSKIEGERNRRWGIVLIDEKRLITETAISVISKVNELNEHW